MKKIFLSLFLILSVSCSNESTIVDICSQNPCKDSLLAHKTVCQPVGNDDFTCVCEPGYKLKNDNCIKISNNTPCENNPCNEEHKTICTVVGDGFECGCDVGYHEENNKCVKDEGTPCENYSCEDDLKNCAIDENGDPYCACKSGYEEINGKCVFDCSNILNSHANEENDACICDENFHIENQECISNTKTVKCRTNPQKPSNSEEIINDVEVTWNEETESWNEIPYCPWECTDNFTGENCDECVENYVLQENTCVFDCSDFANTIPNENNDGCVCKEGYHLNDNNTCVMTVNPCENNPCQDNIETMKTNCITEDNEEGAYHCECENGFEENEDGICTELDSFKIRAVAGNISTGNYQNYDNGEGIRIFQGLKPDIIMIQEFNYKNNSASDYKEMVEAVFQDPGCMTSSPKRCFYEVGTGAVIPNGVISKYPILSWGEWTDPSSGVDSTRHLNYAIVDIPGNKDLFVVSVHLHTSPASDQIEEAEVIVDAINEMKQEADYAGYYFMVGGDFNGPAAACDSNPTDGFGKYNTFSVCDPFPLGEDGSSNTNASRRKHLDWLLVSEDLSIYQIPSKFCNNEDLNDCKIYPTGLVMDTRDFTQTELDTYFSPTEFNGRTLDVDDSDGNSMQHMAIIKDFLIEQ